jgi:hypothetical protein
LLQPYIVVGFVKSSSFTFPAFAFTSRPGMP